MSETDCEIAAASDDDWLVLNGYHNPGDCPGTRDLLATASYVQTPVTVRPVGICQAILDFYGEDYKGMTLGALTRSVRRAIRDHATRVLIIDDITRLKMHREADQDELDLIRYLKLLNVLVLACVRIPRPWRL